MLFVNPEMLQLCAPVGGVEVLAMTHVPVDGVPEATEAVYVLATPSATNEIMTVPEPASATVGCARAAPGIIALEAGETVEVVPRPLGVTVKVYEVPLVKPATVQFCDPVGAVAAATVQVKPPGVEVTT